MSRLKRLIHEIHRRSLWQILSIYLVSSPMSSFLQRLKERKIVQWGVMYLAGAWLFLEVLGFVADTFGRATCAGPSIQGGTS